MNTCYLSARPAEWWLMATIQVAENAPNLSAILSDLDYNFRLEPAPASPPGYRWINLLVDARRGARRCAYTAHRLLSALQRIADGGDLPSFSIIAGERWLDRASIDFQIVNRADADQRLRGATAVERSEITADHL